MTYKHFSIDEFSCPCCGENNMDHEFLCRLDDARELAKIPFIVTSGYRCEDYNKEVGGVEGSAHTKGLAADLAVDTSVARYKALSALLTYFSRVGISNDFIHVDDDSTKPQEVVWLYD